MPNNSGVRNLPFIRQIPQFGARLYEALSDIINNHATLAQQTNGASGSQPLPPPAISGLKVSGQNGHFNVAITDNADIYRSPEYFLEHADNPAFVNAHTIHIGNTRNHNAYLGNVTRYWRAYSSYGGSAPSAPFYLGGATSPTPVSGGGTNGGPAFLSSQGSGTGIPGEGLSGPGKQPFRSSTGKPPVRGTTSS